MSSGEVTLYLALPGDQLSIRVAGRCRSRTRGRSIRSSGYELEGQIVTRHRRRRVRSPGGRPPPPTGSTVLAVAARQRGRSGGVGRRRSEERGIRSARAVRGAGHLPDACCSPAAEAGTGARRSRVTAILDFGHLRTNSARPGRSGTSPRAPSAAAAQHLTAAIAKAFKADHDRAEQAKQQRGVPGQPGTPGHLAAERQLDAVLREALAPLIRELRQTLASFSASAPR